MSDKKGVIYILTNPSFPEYVKIGYADDIDSRLAALNRSECIPYAFRVYATYEVPKRLSDLKIHEMIDHLNPDLRTIDNINGKERKREFYAMSAEDAYLMFETMAEIHGTEKFLKKIEPNEQQKIDEESAREISQERKSAFSFDKVQIKPGEEIEFWFSPNNKSNIKCTVIDDKHVEYENKKYTLSALATKLLNSATSVAGPRYFKYNGEWLNDIRNSLGT